MTLDVLERIRDSKDQRFIGVLERWKRVEVRKVSDAISDVIKGLE